MNRIRELRELRGWSQAKLAELVGTTQPQIDRLEKGHRKLTEEWMRRLGSALDVFPTELIEAATAEIESDDAEPHYPDAGSNLVAPLRKRNLAYFRVKTDNVALAGASKGTVLLVETSDKAIAGRKTGDLLIVQATGVGEKKRSFRLLRQFIEPRILTTNRSGRNISLALDETAFRIEVKGVVVSG